MLISRRMFSRRWLGTTLSVFAGAIVLIRLGIWQLDRLAERRTFNARVESAQSMPVLSLNLELPANIEDMEWRSVSVSGRYDYDHQVALRNQYDDGRLGYHLITPLIFNSNAPGKSSQTILVDRGWIPFEENSTPADWRKYDRTGEVSIEGRIRLGEEKPAIGVDSEPSTNPGELLFTWNYIDMTRLASQLPYPILPVLIQPFPDLTSSSLPIPIQPVLDLTEGPHFGYAMQWFAFACSLVFGYPIYLRRQEKA